MGARILVVDDSVTIQKVVELTLSKEDFVLVQARNGEEGLRKAMEVRPDLVLLDILMPDKDGYEVCAALRAQPALRNVPVILLTGTFEVYDKEKAAKVGADDFVTKPFESQVLIGKVKKLLFTRSLTARAPSGSMGAVGRPPVAELSLANVAVEAPAPPPEASRASGLSAPSLELSQDQLWQLLEAPPPPPPPAAAALDLSLDTLEPPPAAEPTEAELPEAAALDLETAAAEPEPPPLAAAALDLNLDALEPPPAAEPTEAELPEAAALDLETAAAEPGIPPAAPGALELEAFQPTEEAASTRLGDLSLDDLLAGAVESPADPGTAGPAAEETAEGEQVFDLTPSLDMPPLAMVEAGTGEPPSLSIEELLSSIEKGTPLAGAPAEAGAGPPEVDLSAVLSSEESAGSAADAADESAEPILDMELPGIEAAQPSAAPPAEPIAGIARVGVGAPDLDLESAALEPPAAMPAEAAAPLFEDVAAPAAEAPALDLASVVGEPPAAFAAPAEAAAAAAELAEMRDAVTERVARDLARELSEKLLARIDAVVWEVVPDLAEVLIAREIERIRRMAEEQKNA